MVKILLVRQVAPALAGLISTLPLQIPTARAELVYSNNFNDAVGTSYAEWSSSVITYSNSISPPGSGTLPAPGLANTASPNNRQTFLGLLGGPAIGTASDPGWNHTREDQTVSLSLSNLPPHTALQVGFDLYTIRSWDGDSPAYGRDRFILSVAGGPTLLDTTLSDNPKTNSDGSYQDYPVADSAPWTGAISAGTLGYDGFFQDGIYHLQYSFSDTNTNVTIRFSSSLFEGKGTNDEAWGLDNVVVQTVTNVDAPSINLQPSPETVITGQTANFSVIVTGGQPFDYQWLAGVTNSGVYTNLTDAGNISGSTNWSLTIRSARTNNAGDYIVVITNSAGAVTSSVARLTVVVPGPGLSRVYEPFNYPTGVLTNFDGGGSGWLGNWMDPATTPWDGVSYNNQKPPPQVISPGLAYPGLGVSSNALDISAKSALRQWNQSLLSPGQSLWVSFLFNPTGTGNNNAVIAPFAFTNSAANAGKCDYTLGEGATITYNGSTWTVAAKNRTSSAGFSLSSPLTLSSSAVSLIVMQLSYNGGGGADSVNVWANPALDSAPTTGGVTQMGNLDQTGWFSVRGGSTFAGAIDEIRMGTNFASVAPPPPVAMQLQPTGPNLQLSWGLGTLLDATNVIGPWATNNASSPYLVTPTNPMKFYRAQVR